MSNFLIIYSTTDGHTKIICERIKNFLMDGNFVELLSLEDANKVDLYNFEKIIIGASIRYGKHSKELYKFINLKKNILDKKKVLFSQLTLLQENQKRIQQKLILTLINF